MSSIVSKIVPVFSIYVALITLCITTAQGQNKGGEKYPVVTGTVCDFANRPIENASVSLESSDPAYKFTVHSGPEGHYRFENVPTGNYRLRATKSGYGVAQHGPFSVGTEEHKSVTLKLPVDESAAIRKDRSVEPQFSGEVHFNVAGVSDPSNLGGHGSDTVLHTKETLAKETASLSRETAIQPGNNSLPAAGVANAHVKLAEAAEIEGRPLDAVREYQQAAELQPSEPHLFAWGADLLLHRAFEPAIEVFTKGHRFYPGSMRMLLGLSVASYDQGSMEGGKKLLLEACDLDPADPSPYLFLSQLQDAEKIEPQGWTEKFARFVRLHPENPLAHYDYAVALRKQETGSTNTALIESELKRAIEMDPQLGPAYLELGISYSQRNDYPRAISSFRKAIESTSLPAEAHYRLAQVYEHTGAAEQARQEIELFKQISEQKKTEAERERHNIQQFVYTLRSQSPSSPPPTSEPH